jgi:hypothetical protein
LAETQEEKARSGGKEARFVAVEIRSKEGNLDSTKRDPYLTNSSLLALPMPTGEETTILLPSLLSLSNWFTGKWLVMWGSLSI